MRLGIHKQRRLLPRQRRLLAGQRRLLAETAVCTAFTIIAAAQPAHGQQQDPAARDAQQYQRSRERQAQEQRRNEPEPDVRTGADRAGAGAAASGQSATRERQPLPTDEAPCVSIAQLELTGDEAGRFRWLLDAVAGPHGNDSPLRKCLGARGIAEVTERAQEALRDAGYATSRVLTQPQSLKDGVLRLTVLPGRVHGVRFADAGSSTRAGTWNTVPARPGDILNARDVEQALENFKRVPTAQADIAIEPVQGGRPDESDLVIRHSQPRLYRLSVSADDSGTRSTGKYQGAVTLSYDNWWTLSDLFYLTVNHDLGGGDPGYRGTRGGTLHYSLPLGYWTVGTTLSANRYAQTVAGATQDYVYSGSSRTAEVRLSRIVQRTANGKTTASLRAFRRESASYIDDTEIQVQHRVVGGWELGIAHRMAIGDATLEGNAAYRRGTGAFGSLPAPEEAFGEGTSRLAVITADASLNAPFELGGMRLRYSGNWRGQAPRTPLTPQDRFAIGGRYTVRGFDGESSLSAERGWLLRNELSTPLADTGHEIFAALDHGRVGGPSAATLAGTQLTGAAIGLRGAISASGPWGGLQYEVFVGAPLNKPAGFTTARTTAGFQLNYAL